MVGDRKTPVKRKREILWLIGVSIVIGLVVAKDNEYQNSKENNQKLWWMVSGRYLTHIWSYRMSWDLLHWARPKFVQRYQTHNFITENWVYLCCHILINIDHCLKKTAKKFSHFVSSISLVTFHTYWAFVLSIRNCHFVLIVYFSY